MSNDPPTRGKVIVRTTLGPIDIELFSKESPKTCRTFIQLCQEGFYNQKRCFGRAIKSVLVETGAIPGSTINHQDGLPFASENHGRLRFTTRGRVACVACNGASSDFFISLDKCEWLNGKHTIFGKVVGDSLFNVVRIGELDTDKEDKPYEPPEILSVEVVENPFEDIICREFPKKKDVTSSSSYHSIQNKKFGTGGGGGGGGEEEDLSNVLLRTCYHLVVSMNMVRTLVLKKKKKKKIKLVHPIQSKAVKQ
jgi:peptidyl-prolyl cis-trans isomerase SDCCAG10